MNNRITKTMAAIATLLLMSSAIAGAQSQSQSQANRLAKMLANPLASMVSVPMQYNHDSGIGPGNHGRSTFNLQPVVPISLGMSARWTLISRTIVPYVNATYGTMPGGEISGIGDVTQSFFLTSKSPVKGGWMIGVGPVLQLPSGTDPMLTNDKLSVGPTAVAVRQNGQLTYGALTNHMWSVTGDDEGHSVNATFVQPFINYITPTHTTLILNAEATRDWKSDTWSVPVHVMVSQLLKIGSQPFSVFVGARYWAKSTDQGPEGWGLRAGLTLIFWTARPPHASR